MAMDIPSRNRISEGSRRRGGRSFTAQNVPGVGPARDPGLSVPQGAFQGGFEGVGQELAGAFDNIAVEVERQQKVHDYNATRRAANEFNRAILDDWNTYRTEQDPTAPDFATNFETVTRQRMDDAIGRLPDGVSAEAREQLRLDLDARRIGWYDQAGTLQIRESQAAAIDTYNGQISGIAALAYENPEILDELLVRADTEMNAVSGILGENEERDKSREGYRSIFEGAFNATVERRDFDTANAMLNDERYQAFLDESDREHLRGAIEREQAEIVREQEAAERQRQRDEAAFIDRFDRTIQALSMGAPLSPVMMDQISPSTIANNIADPEQRQVMRSQAEAAQHIRRSTETVPQMSQEEMQLHLQSLLQSEPQNLDSEADIADWNLWREQVSAVQTLAAQTLQARVEDPAAEAMRRNPEVQASWMAYRELSQPGSEATPQEVQAAFEAYRYSLSTVYDTQGYTPGSRILPKAFAADLAQIANNQWASDPETVSMQMAALADSMGVDWSRGFAELQDAGLTPEVAALGWMQENPALQQRVVAIAQNGGLNALEEAVPADKRRTVDEALSLGMVEARQGAGAENQGFLQSAHSAAQILAYDLVSRGVPEVDAANQALAQVLDTNFTVVAGTNVKGLVDPGLTIDQDALDVGAGQWLRQAVNAPQDAPPLDSMIVEMPDGKYAIVPPNFEAAVNPAAAMDNAESAGQSFERFESHRDAVASLVPEGMTLASAQDQTSVPLLEVHPVMLREFRFPEGLSMEGMQNLARASIAETGYFMLSVDGKNAVLVTESFGLPTEVIGMDGQPIMVPVRELEGRGQWQSPPVVVPDGPGVPDQDPTIELR